MSDNTIRQGILELLERECSILDFDNLWSSEELEGNVAERSFPMQPKSDFPLHE